MPEFTHVVFSKGRPESVDHVRELVGDTVFKDLQWFVAHGERQAYVAAGAKCVHETGDLCHTVQRAIDTTNHGQIPLTFMSDDVRGFYCKQGHPASWGSCQGRSMDIVGFAIRILQAMRQVGTPMGGVYQMASTRTQLSMPAISYHHFCNLDFLVFDPPFKFMLHCDARVNVKVDYHLSASILAAFGAVCRMNHLCINAPHYKPGGAGTMQQRRKADAEAVRWLQAHWKSSIGGQEQVFIGNTMRRGNRQVVMNGTPLLDMCDSRLREVHKQVRLAMQSPGKQVYRAGCRNPLAFGSVGCPRQHKSTKCKRAIRGTSSTGPARSKGRLKLGKDKMSDAARQRLSRARGLLRSIVLELRRRQTHRRS